MFPLPSLSTNKLFAVALGLVIVSALAVIGWLTVDRERLRTQLADAKTELAQAREASARQVADLTNEYRARETLVAQQMTQQEAAANETIASLTRRADQLAASLRDAKRRASEPTVPTSATNPGAEQAAGGGDGPFVPAEIGEPDVAEALRADTIRVELLRCYAAHDLAVEVLSRPLPNPTP